MKRTGIIEKTVKTIAVFGSAVAFLFYAFAAHGACGEIIWTRALCKEPGHYIGWPSVTRCADGRLLAVFSGDRDGHICPWGKVQMVESRDNGETWSAPRTLRNSPLDDRDAGILELKNGGLLLTWFTSLAFTTLKGNPYARHAEKIQEEDRIRHLGHFTMRSTDGGKTWEKPVPTCSSAPHGGIQLKDGRLMMIGREWSSQAGMSAADPRKGKMQDRVVAEVSEDGGRSWKVVNTLTPPTGQTAASLSLCEPTLAELPDGTIIAQFRADRAGQTVYQSESRDGGANWTVLHPTPLCGLPPHLLVLRDGRLLSTYTRRRAWDPAKNETSELKACISKDGGATWNTAEEIVLATSSSADMGYSSTVELDNGNLLTVYYMHEKPNEGCCLMGTLWRPAPFVSHGLTALGACDGGNGVMDDPRAWTILNMDCNYYENCKSDDIMSREAMDRHVGERLKGPVTHFFVNPQGMVACYPSKVVETVWSRPPWIKDDPMKKDWVRHLKTMFDRGLDRFQIFIDSARKRGVEGWISMRMNDVHGVDVRDSQPCSLWHDHPEFWRVPNAQNAKIAQSANWMSRAFDYSHKEVREHHIRYAEELLERYDMDGFDVDWTRFPAHLTPGKERSESECLTEVMRAIRHRANLEAARRGHRVLVSATVLSSPEAALGAGMDVIQWAREGLLDVVIVANFFFCMDFDTPYAEWVRLLHNVNPSVRVVCRADCNVAIYSGAIFCVDGAGYRGYYDNMIAQGCRDFGFFNLFETDSEKAKTVIEEGIMSGAGRRFPRKYIFTYRDYVAEGTDAHRQFPIKLDVPRKVSFLIGSTTGAKNASLEFALDGKPVDGFMPTVNGIPAIAPVAKAPDVRWYEKYYEGKVAPPDSYRAKFSVSALKDGYNEIVFPMLDGATVKCAWLILE